MIYQKGVIFVKKKEGHFCQKRDTFVKKRYFCQKKRYFCQKKATRLSKKGTFSSKEWTLLSKKGVKKWIFLSKKGIFVKKNIFVKKRTLLSNKWTRLFDKKGHLLSNKRTLLLKRMVIFIWKWWFFESFFLTKAIFFSDKNFYTQPPWHGSMGSGRQRESHIFFVAKILNFLTYFLASFFMKKLFF